MFTKDHLIEKIRHSSREMARELGLLSSDSNFQLPISLTHTLIELDLNGALNQIELAAKLNLNKSSVSRIIKKLIQQKLVSVSSLSKDQRYKRCVLTSEGKKIITKIHQNANQQVFSALQQMSQAEQEHVVSGLELYAKALKRSRVLNEFLIRPIQKSDNLDIMMIIKKILKEYGADRPGFAFVDLELDDMYHAFSKSKSAYFIVERKTDKKVIGGAGLGSLLGGDKSICELKKMYFLPEFRGHGLGSTLIQKLLTAAKELGYKQCYMETLKSMEKANYLYKSYGFKPLNKPIGKTGHYGCDTWYLKNL